MSIESKNSNLVYLARLAFGLFKRGVRSDLHICAGKYDGSHTCLGIQDAYEFIIKFGADLTW